MKKLILIGLLFSQSIIADVIRIDNGSQTYRVDKQQSEQVIIQEENYSITIKEINDTRCPPGMVCFSDHLWEGDVTVDLEVSLHNGYNEAMTVIYRDDSPAIINIQEYRFIITNIVKLKNDKYKIILLVIPS